MPAIAAVDERPQVDDLAPVEIEDAATFLDAYAQSDARSAIQFFPRLYWYGRGQRHPLRWERHGDSILLYQLRPQGDGQRLNLYLPPLPFSDAALRAGLERMADFNGGGRGAIVWVPEGEALAIAHAGLSVRFKMDEYIYDRAAVTARTGSEFRSLRKDLSRAHNQGTVELRPYRTADQEPCLALLRRWRDRLTESGHQVTGYRVAIDCLTNADRFGPALLRGLVAEVDGVIRGFSFSGHLADRMGCNFLGITDRGFRGLPQLLVCQLMADFPEHETFNDSDDVGRPGLREVKRRFRPVRMLGLFTARER